MAAEWVLPQNQLREPPFSLPPAALFHINSSFDLIHQSHRNCRVSFKIKSFCRIVAANLPSCLLLNNLLLSEPIAICWNYSWPVFCPHYSYQTNIASGKYLLYATSGALHCVKLCTKESPAMVHPLLMGPLVRDILGKTEFPAGSPDAHGTFTLHSSSVLSGVL